MSANQWIIGELERIIAELRKSPGPQQGATAFVAPAAVSKAVPAGWKRAKVTFWAVEEKMGQKGPYTAARVGLSWIENGERKSEFLSTFNRELIMRIDPLEKGTSVEYQDETKGQYRNLVDIRPV